MPEKLIFSNRENRDAEWRRIGGVRGTIRGACLHPQYVADADPALRSKTGYGNLVYKTFWPVLYTLSLDPRF